MKYIPIRFNIINPSVEYNFPDMPHKPVIDTITVWVDSYYGSDTYGDGTPEKPYKTAKKAYDMTGSHTNAINVPAIVLRGYFDIDFEDINVYWIGDDGNTVINYPNNNGKSGCYINLTVKGYLKRPSGYIFSYRSNLNSERETTGGSFFSGGYKNYCGVVDLRNSKPAGELLGGYWDCVLLGNKVTGGIYNCLFKGQLINSTVPNNNIFFADCTYLVNNQDVSYLSERNNYSTDEAYTAYIKAQSGFNSLFSNNSYNIAIRYTFDEVFVYDEENLSISLTEVGKKLADKYASQFSWIKGNKNIPILSNSDGVKECFDNNTKSGGIDIVNDTILIDETQTYGQIRSKVIRLNRATQAINGLVSGLRHTNNQISTSFEIIRKPSEMISIISDVNRTITSSEEGYYFIEENSTAPSNPKISYNGNEIDFVPDSPILLTEGDVLTRVNDFSYNLVPIIQPNAISNFYLRGVNTFKETITSGALSSGYTYIAVDGSATLTIGNDTRILTDGESIDATGTEELISGKLGLVFNSSDPWFIIDSNCDQFGIGLYNGYSGYEIPYIDGTKYKDNRGNDIYLTKSVKVPSSYDSKTSNGISFRYVQIKLEYSIASMNQHQNTVKNVALYGAKNNYWCREIVVKKKRNK